MIQSFLKTIKLMLYNLILKVIALLCKYSGLKSNEFLNIYYDKRGVHCEVKQEYFTVSIDNVHDDNTIYLLIWSRKESVDSITIEQFKSLRNLILRISNLALAINKEKFELEYYVYSGHNIQREHFQIEDKMVVTHKFNN